MFSVDLLIKSVQTKFDAFVAHYDVVITTEEYAAISDDVKKSYDAILIQMGSIAMDVLADQMKINSNLLWVHALSAGIDGIVANQQFKESPIPLTNAKGAYSEILGEFILAGVLYHTKHIEKFVQQKQDKSWTQIPITYARKKTLAIIGFGDIGSACAKAVKMGLGMRVIGVKRNPKDVTAE
mmetsp:Transcript_5446/g.9198  ORF Transcript_5446/g.9198 Transcript_5446/m.9198 type:complete len:182 (+) Transcript_5446:63-608(+)